MPRRTPPDTAAAQLIREEAWDKLSDLLSTCHPADIADIIDRAPSSLHEQVFSLLDDSAKPSVLAELESVAGTDVIESLTNSELSHIVEEISPDDAADVLSDLPGERSEKVLRLMEKEESEDVRLLLKYEEDTAGGIMTTDVIAMHEDQTVQEALQAIAHFDTSERFFNAMIVDDANHLIGHIDVWDLLRERDKDRHLADLIHRDTVIANVDMDQEEVVHLISQYNLSAIPVTDADGTLVGRVTADDVLDVMEDEATEDILRLGGSTDAILESDSFVRACMIRLPWLLVTLVGGGIIYLIMESFCSRISGMANLVFFVPLVMAMGGNTGIQSSTLMVRSIALGNMKGQSMVAVLLKEVFTGALMGLICGTIVGLAVALMPSAESSISPHSLAIVVSVALFSAMTFAATFGAFVPVALDKAGIDPAVASGPFITIANDIAALMIYFAVTAALINQMA